MQHNWSTNWQATVAVKSRLIRNTLNIPEHKFIHAIIVRMSHHGTFWFESFNLLKWMKFCKSLGPALPEKWNYSMSLFSDFPIWSVKLYNLIVWIKNDSLEFANHSWIHEIDLERYNHGVGVCTSCCLPCNLGEEPRERCWDFRNFHNPCIANIETSHQNTSLSESSLLFK